MRVGPGGQPQVAYSAKYLKGEANQWIQWLATESLGDREIATHPLALVYDDGNDTVVAAMRLQGVAVGTPGGAWRRVAVGPYAPIDFSIGTRFRRYEVQNIANASQPVEHCYRGVRFGCGTGYCPPAGSGGRRL
jgi:hypothetical protein